MAHAFRPWVRDFDAVYLESAIDGLLFVVPGCSNHRPSRARKQPCDADAAERLHGWGLHNAVVGADPVIGLEPEPVEPDDTMCVILRPATRRGVRTAAGDAKPALRHSATLDRLARTIDEAPAATGLRPRFVAFQASRDGPLHEALASRLAAPAEAVAPTLHPD